jgi:hypothetical protein
VRQNCEESISRLAGARIKPVERKGEQFVDPCVVSQHVDNREDGEVCVGFCCPSLRYPDSQRNSLSKSTPVRLLRKS